MNDQRLEMSSPRDIKMQIDETLERLDRELRDVLPTIIRLLDVQAPTPTIGMARSYINEVTRWDLYPNPHNPTMQFIEEPADPSNANNWAGSVRQGSDGEINYLSLYGRPNDEGLFVTYLAPGDSSNGFFQIINDTYAGTWIKPALVANK